MKVGKIFLEIAKDEAETLSRYQGMIDDAEDMDDESREIINEIMEDELNHALIAILWAAKTLGLSISTDSLSEDPNKIEVE